MDQRESHLHRHADGIVADSDATIPPIDPLPVPLIDVPMDNTWNDGEHQGGAAAVRRRRVNYVADVYGSYTAANSLASRFDAGCVSTLSR